MERVYRYRVHIRKMRDVIPLVLIVIAILLIAMVLIIGGSSSSGIMVIGFLGGILIFEAIAIRLVFNRFLKVNCKLSEEGIVYTNIKKTIIIPYEDITEIEFPSIKYLGGWIKINSPKEIIRLTVVIENIQQFVLDLKNEVDTRELTPIVKEKNFQGFIRTATYSDHSWQRVYKIWLRLLGLTILATVMSVGIYIVGNLSLPGIFLVGIFGYALPVTVYSICEISLGKWLSNQFQVAVQHKNSLHIERSLEHEKKIYSNGLKIGSGFYVFVMLLFIVINL